MKKLAFFTMVGICFALPTISGCGGGGGGENTVIEAPPEAVDEQPAIEGMSDEEYDKAMEEDMNQ